MSADQLKLNISELSVEMSRLNEQVQELMSEVGKDREKMKAERSAKPDPRNIYRNA